MALVRDVLIFSKFFKAFDFAKVSAAGHLQISNNTISVRTAKHYNPKFRWLRSKKYIPIVLPHTEKHKELQKKNIKELGIFPRHWKTRPLTVTTTSEIIEPYTPPDGDGKASILSKGNPLSLATASKSKLSDITALRKIKNYDSEFDKKIFLQEAHDIYVNAHTVLMKKNIDDLSEFATEKAVQEMMNGIKNQTIRWKFIESIEPPALVQSRVVEVITKTNLFAQITIRFHTKQSLAIYDRFGRLMFGNEFLAKDVLEYVVFEKHINNENGKWRLHGKIIPEWHESLITNISKTYRVQAEEEEDDDEIDFDERDPEPEPEHKSTAEIVPTTEAKSEKL